MKCETNDHNQRHIMANKGPQFKKVVPNIRDRLNIDDKWPQIPVKQVFPHQDSVKYCERTAESLRSAQQFAAKERSSAPSEPQTAHFAANRCASLRSFGPLLVILARIRGIYPPRALKAKL